MTVFRKCRVCTKKDGCEHKKVICKTIKGLGITSILHKCDHYDPPYSTGDPVLATTLVSYDVGGGYEEPERATFPAHFMTQRGTKAHVYIKPGVSDTSGLYEFDPKNNGFCNLPFERVKAHPDGDPIEVCDHCHEPKGITSDSYFGCHHGSPNSQPENQ